MKRTAASRGTIACKLCRQSKVRCDGDVQYPAPCSRCQKKSIICTIDHDMVRTLQQKKPTNANSVNDSSSSHSSVSLPAANPLSSQSPALPNVSHVPVLEEPYTASQPAFLSLGQFSIPWTDAENLFQQFIVYQYQHCPIIPKDSQLADLFRASPILIWTILLITSLRNKAYSHHHERLFGPYQAMLGEMLIASTPRLDSVQALVLLMYWPTQDFRLPSDPTWRLCGWATHAALQLRLNRHSHAKASQDAIDIPYGLATWMACYYFPGIMTYIRSCPLPVSPKIFGQESDVISSQILCLPRAISSTGWQTAG
ncbi:hypothetical protein K461DRAFT_265718 [Myriangium duriaei CBS 260.36]|uniref:Zn(2)-C6 fungal-type domain-containing protein n=1 Tax=Myriangium duriaei CBS 260.36 TaxID=1168546 RepID=A0A9P4JC72_9PEZI|nr:hypothetical protein K461DRAFT_265718 [Myriangium duriaei CBS 260.36]